MNASVLNGTVQQQQAAEDGFNLICNMPGISEHAQHFIMRWAARFV
jgi:hypothetical protein